MAWVPALASVWEIRGPSPESRRAVESCHPVTIDGPVQLDKEPDVAQILLLSDAFIIDELVALQLVQRGYAQVGEISAAAGGRQLLEDVISSLQTLVEVLDAEVGARVPATWVPPTELAYIQEKLSSDTSAESLPALLIRRLTKPLGLHTDRLATLVNSSGQAFDPGTTLAQIDLLLAQCLFCALTLLAARDQPLGAHVQALVTLLKGTVGARDRAHIAPLVELCTLCMLLPLGAQSVVEPDTSKTVEAVIAELPDGVCSSIKLVWTLSQTVEKGVRGSGSLKSAADAALNAGVLGHLWQSVLLAPALVSGPSQLRIAAAHLVHRFVAGFLGTTDGHEAVTSLTQKSLAGSKAEFGPEASLVLAAKSGAVVGNDGTVGQPRSPDDLASLLHLFAATLEVAPELFLDESLREEEFLALMSPSGVGRPQVLGRVPSVFVAYYAVLAAIAGSTDGARSIFVQLSAEHATELIGWRQVFEALQQVVRRFEVQPRPQSEDKLGEDALPPWDSAGVCAQVRLLSAVFKNGFPTEVPLWMVAMRDAIGLSSVWDALIQAMCCPVPQELKAELDRALEALARLPEVAPLILQRLLPAVVPQARDPSSQPTLPHYDLGYQLNEIEARAERYDESIAFTQLINTLWRSATPQTPAAAQVSEFIINMMLATVFQRSYRNEVHKWQVAAGGLEHAALLLERAAAVEGSPFAPLVHSMLLDLAGERGLWHVLWQTLEGGAQGLAAAQDQPWGRDREAALLAGLRVLAAALGATTTTATSTISSASAVADAVLRHATDRLGSLLGLTGYTLSTTVALAAVGCASELAHQRPSLGAALLTAPGAWSHDVNAAAEVRDACASALLWAASQEPDQDDSATLDVAILDLLLAHAADPYPSLASVLCGLVDEAGLPVNYGRDLPQQQGSVLDALLKIVADPGLASARPAMYERTLALLQALLNVRETRVAVADALLEAAPALAGVLDRLARAPATENSTLDGTSSAPLFAQRAWLLLLIADLAHAAEPSIARHHEAAAVLLSTLLNRDVSVGLLEMLVVDQGLMDVTSAIQQRFQALGLDAILNAAPTQPALEGLAAEVAGIQGMRLIDLAALKDALLQRFEEVVAGGGWVLEDVREACQQALRCAQQQNAWVESCAARCFMAGAWRDAIIVTATSRLQFAAASAEEAISLLSQSLDAALAATVRLAASDLAPAELATAQASAALAAALLACVRRSEFGASCAPPPALVLQAMLSALLRGVASTQTIPEARTALWAALSSLLALGTAADDLEVSPTTLLGLQKGGDQEVVSAVLEAEDTYGATTDALLGTIRAARPAIGRLASDAASSDAVQAATALSLLVTLVTADVTGVIAEVVAAQGLPTRLLQGLASLDREAMMQVSSSPIILAEAGLNLLLAMALSGSDAEERAQSAERLLALQAPAALAACEALAAWPESPTDPLRVRLHGLLTPALRLVLALVEALPQGPRAQRAALGFIASREAVLGRIMHDAAREKSARQADHVGARELEQASLVVGLLAAAPEAVTERPALVEAVWRLCTVFLCRDDASNAAAVCRVEVLRGTGWSKEGELESLLKRVCDLRCALSRFLRRTNGKTQLMPERPEPGAPAVQPSLLLIKDALQQVISRDIPELLSSAQLLPGDEELLPAGFARETTAAIHVAAQLHRLVALMEQLLAVLLSQLRLAQRKGLTANMDRLERSLQPVLLQVDELVASEGRVPLDAARLQDLGLFVRRVREAAATVAGLTA